MSPQVPHLDTFHTGWLYCALGGACVFLLLQMVLVTQVHHTLPSDWSHLTLFSDWSHLILSSDWSGRPLAVSAQAALPSPLMAPSLPLSGHGGAPHYNLGLRLRLAVHQVTHIVILCANIYFKKFKSTT